MCQTKDTVQVLRQTGGNQSTRLTMRIARNAAGVISLFDNPNGNCRMEHQTTGRQRPTRRNKPEWLMADTLLLMTTINKTTEHISIIGSLQFI